MAPRETENNAYAKFWGDKQRTLWYVMVFLEWSIDPIQFKIVDSTLWIPDSRYWIQDSLLVKLGFWIPVVSGSSDSLS